MGKVQFKQKRAIVTFSILNEWVVNVTVIHWLTVPILPISTLRVFNTHTNAVERVWMSLKHRYELLLWITWSSVVDNSYFQIEWDAIIASFIQTGNLWTCEIYFKLSILDILETLQECEKWKFCWVNKNSMFSLALWFNSMVYWFSVLWH